MQNQIKKIEVKALPLSTGNYTIGVSVQLGNGILEWDASPIGTTITVNDPICFTIEEANERIAETK